MKWYMLIPMFVVGAVVNVLTFRAVRYFVGGSVPHAQALAIWLMLLSFWIFLRKVPANKNIHFGFYVAASLVVSVCAVFIAYRL